ncbi:unnamed protein product, partial [marine sediment metagenome]
KIAIDWVGCEHADGLVKAWQLCDTSVRHRPMWDVFPARKPQRLPGPLIPNPDGLDFEEMSYCYRQEWADLESIAGRHRLDLLRIDEVERSWMIKMYRDETLTLLEQAVQLLEQEIA